MPEFEIINAKEGSEMTGENTIRCLDKGFVRLVDCMGDDAAVVQAARVSYGAGTKSVRRDRGLINYLMKHHHTTPFEMVEFKFHVKLPIFVARQWIRHRTANVNEISARYSILEETVWELSEADLRTQSATNRQTSSEELIEGSARPEILASFKADQSQLFQHYYDYIEKGVAREIARANLPLSTYTEWYWKIDLHNLLHFLWLRMDKHAQKEIRVYANAVAEFVRGRCPLSWQAFEEHRIKSVTFSGSVAAILRDVIKENWLIDKIIELRRGQLKEEGASETSIRIELDDLRTKLTNES